MKKKKDKILLSAASVLLSCMLCLQPAAARADEAKPDAGAPESYLAGNSVMDAETIATGQSVTGSLSASNTKDYYKFRINTSGRVTLNVTSGTLSKANYYIYDIEEEQVWGKSISRGSASAKVAEPIDLVKGTYYFAITRDKADGDYTFRLSFESAGESFDEEYGGTDNERGYANPVRFGTSYRGQLAVNDDIDFYAFTLKTSGRVSLAVSAQIRSMHCYFFDTAGNTLWNKQPYWNNTTKVLNLNTEIDLTKGTYYFAAKAAKYTGNYSFQLSFTDAGESFSETRGGTNNSMSRACPVLSDTVYKGQLAKNDKRDFYKFTVKDTSEVTLKATAEITWVYYRIYDSSGKQLWQQSLRWNDTSERSSLTKKITLPKGTCYLAVDQYSTYTGNYSFQLHIHNYKSAVKKATLKKNGTLTRKCSCGKLLSKKTVYRPKELILSRTTYTYNGKVKKPSVKVKDIKGKVISRSQYTVSYAPGRKRVGTYKVTVKFKGSYKGSMSKKFQIRP